MVVEVRLGSPCQHGRIKTYDPSAHRRLNALIGLALGEYDSVLLTKDLPSALPTEKNLFPLPMSSQVL